MGKATRGRHALGNRLNDAVSAIAVAGRDVYVGGKFTDAGGNGNGDYVAGWRVAALPPTRYALGSGLNNPVGAIAVVGPDLYVGGLFTDAGRSASADYVARWETIYRVYLPLVLRNH